MYAFCCVPTAVVENSQVPFQSGWPNLHSPSSEGVLAGYTGGCGESPVSLSNMGTFLIE